METPSSYLIRANIMKSFFTLPFLSHPKFITKSYWFYLQNVSRIQPLVISPPLPLQLSHCHLLLELLQQPSHWSPSFHRAPLQAIFFFCLFRVAPACGGSQVMGGTGAGAAGHSHSHSKAGSEPRLRPTQKLTAMADPWPTGHPHGCSSDLFPLSHDGNSPTVNS